jgi:hypothetical protein
MTGVRSLITPLCVYEFIMALPFHLCKKKNICLIVEKLKLTSNNLLRLECDLKLPLNA